MISQHSVSVLCSSLLQYSMQYQVSKPPLWTVIHGVLVAQSCSHVTTLPQSWMPKTARSHSCSLLRGAYTNQCCKTKDLPLWENACFSPPSEADGLVDKADVICQTTSGQASRLCLALCYSSCRCCCDLCLSDKTSLGLWLQASQCFSPQQLQLACALGPLTFS